MSSLVQQLISYPLVIIWMIGNAVLCFRTRAMQNALLQRFEHHIDFFADEPIFFPNSVQAYRDVVRGIHEPQADAEAEQLRREMRRRNRQFLIWLFGFPALCIGVAAILIATRLVRPL